MHWLRFNKSKVSHAWYDGELIINIQTGLIKLLKTTKYSDQGLHSLTFSIHSITRTRH